jgi:hypothetical protein
MNSLTTAIVGVVAGLVVGGAAGAGTYALSSDPRTSKEYRGTAAQLRERTAALEDAEGSVAAAEDAVAAVEADMTALEGDLPAREASVEAALADIKRKNKIIAKARRTMRAAIEDVERRERAVGIVERQIARNTVSGDGTYRVGIDMQPGTYRSVDNGGGCYYDISSDANGSNLIDNGFTTGPSLATVGAGQFFSTSDCGDWVLQR